MQPAVPPATFLLHCSILIFSVKFSPFSFPSFKNFAQLRHFPHYFASSSISIFFQCILSPPPPHHIVLFRKEFSLLLVVVLTLPFARRVTPALGPSSEGGTVELEVGEVFQPVTGSQTPAFTIKKSPHFPGLSSTANTIFFIN